MTPNGPPIGSTREDIDRAARLAAKAFRVYRDLAAESRAAFLEAIAQETLALGDQLLTTAARETNLGQARLTGERSRTVQQLRMFANTIREGSWVEARIDRPDPTRTPAPRPDLRRMLTPLGPVAVFGASNFPFAFSVAGGDTASALAAGCPVLVKAHPNHPATSELSASAVFAAAKATGMPDGVFCLLVGHNDASIELVTHPMVAAVGFTGSRAAGLALLNAAQQRPCPIPVYAEMSSVNPVFILPGAMRERGDAIAAGLTASFTLGAGQFCTNPGLVFAIQGSQLHLFLGALANAVANVAPAPMLHQRIHTAFEQGKNRLKLHPGVRLIAEATNSAQPHSLGAQAIAFVTDIETFAADEELSSEIFGPLTIVVGAESLERLEDAALRLEGQLTASIHGTPEDFEQYRALISILQSKVGRLIFNAYPTGVEVAPAMHHGGPFPATSDIGTTSVGTAAMSRFARPICFQDAPQALLPPELQDDNPLGILRLVDNEFTR